MKKFFVSLLVALCGAVSLFADDVADVKAVIVKNSELQAKNDFLGAFALITTDYQEHVQGTVFNYLQLKWLFTSMDGKHPREFLLYCVSREMNGMPSAELQRRIMEGPIPADLLQMYENTIRQAIEYNNSEAEAWSKTAKFTSVKVDGDTAVAVVEYDGQNPQSGAVEHKKSTTYLRRENGVWRMYKCVR